MAKNTEAATTEQATVTEQAARGYKDFSVEELLAEKERVSGDAEMSKEAKDKALREIRRNLRRQNHYIRGPRQAGGNSTQTAEGEDTEDDAGQPLNQDLDVATGDGDGEDELFEDDGSDDEEEDDEDDE